MLVILAPDYALDVFTIEEGGPRPRTRSRRGFFRPSNKMAIQ